MVADGMSPGTFTAADYFSQQVRGRGLRWLDLYRRPETRLGWMNMRSLNSIVTDSSAASSSWGSGSRVANGAVNQLPDGTKLRTLFELFADRGWKRGLVTTTEITHATPAGFSACMSSRDTGAAIASQYLERRIDLLLGGGRKFFEPKQRADKLDLKGDFAAAGYQVLENAAQLSQATASWPWLGLFASSHLPFSLDRAQSPELTARVPALATMTRRALEWLGRHDHFILQVEGGRVDHAAHNCDAAGAMRDMIAFDEALEEVLAFRQRHPDTLVVVTTDHGTGNLTINGSGTDYKDSASLFRHVADVKASSGEILRRMRGLPTEEETKTVAAAAAAATTTAASEKAAADAKASVPEVRRIQEVILETTGYKVSDRRAAAFQAFMAKKGSTVYELMNSETTQLGQLLANHLAVGWAGGAHTGDYVPLTAVGPGAERFAGFVQNVEVFRHLTQLVGIDYRNPERPLLASGPSAAEVERVAEYALS
jgi:alkaline phosphatase